MGGLGHITTEEVTNGTYTWHMETLCYLYFEFCLRGYNREADDLFIHLYRSCDMLLRPLLTQLTLHTREDALNMFAEVVFRRRRHSFMDSVCP